MDDRQLRSVLAVIEEGSLGRAAASLNVSQPALTKIIQRLEQQLGVPLFERDTKGMIPTRYGALLKAHAHAIIASTEQAVRDIAALHDGARSTVTIAAGPLVTSEIVAKAIIELLRTDPLIHVRVHTAIGDQLAGLMSGQYDFILAQLPVNGRGYALEHRDLINDRIAVIAKVGHVLTRRRNLSAADLIPFKWVLPVAEHSHLGRLSRVFGAAGLPMPEPDIECSSTDFIKSVVSGTNHLGLIAKMGIKGNTTARVSELDIKSPFMSRPVGMVWRKNQVLSKSSRLLMAAIEAACRNDKR